MSRVVFLALTLIMTGVLACAGALAQATPPPATPTPAEAEPLPYGIQPASSDDAFFDFVAEPGDEVELPVELFNRGDELIEVRTYAADAYTLVNGSFDARLFSEPVEETATWLEYEAEEIEIPAGEAVIRTAIARIPEDAAPGEYFAALVVENAVPVRTGSIEQVVRQLIAVVITIPGPQELGLEIGAATVRQLPGYFSVLVEVANTGNVRIRPSGELEVYDADDELMLVAPIAMGLVLPGDTTSAEIPLPQALPIGEYVAGVLLGDEEAGIPAEYNALVMDVTEPPTPTPAATEPTGPTIFFGSPTPDTAGTPAPTAQTPAASGGEAPAAGAGFQAGTSVILNEDATMRAAADPDAEPVGEFARETTLLIIGPAQEAGGFVWWPVSDPTTGTTGFVRDEFLSPGP